MIVGNESLANFPLKQVLHSLFNVTNVDIAADADQAVQFFTNRITRKCCLRRYRLVICDFELEGAAHLSKTIRFLTRVRLQQERI